MEIKEIIVAVVAGLIFVGIFTFMIIGIRNHIRESGDTEICPQKRKKFMQSLKRYSKNPR